MRTDKNKWAVKWVKDTQWPTKSLRAMNIEKDVNIAIFAASSNMAWTEERGTDEKSSWMALRQIGREWPREISQVTSEAE